MKHPEDAQLLWNGVYYKIGRFDKVWRWSSNDEWVPSSMSTVYVYACIRNQVRKEEKVKLIAEQEKKKQYDAQRKKVK